MMEDFPPEFGFNPTMVRLRLKLLYHVYPLSLTVSIPLWCDCDLAGDFIPERDFMFQSHYGAIATIGMLLGRT